MYPDSRQTIHMGINFLLSPMPAIHVQSLLNFQQSLINYGIDFTKVGFKEPEIAVIREAPTRLEVKVVASGPPPVGQLLILAPYPERDWTLFAREAEAIVKAFDSTWPADSQAQSSCICHL